jgi:hypothetical protein
VKTFITLCTCSTLLKGEESSVQVYYNSPIYVLYSLQHIDFGVTRTVRTVSTYPARYRTVESKALLSDTNFNIPITVVYVRTYCSRRRFFPLLLIEPGTVRTVPHATHKEIISDGAFYLYVVLRVSSYLLRTAVVIFLLGSALLAITTL